MGIYNDIDLWNNEYLIDIFFLIYSYLIMDYIRKVLLVLEFDFKVFNFLLVGM